MLSWIVLGIALTSALLWWRSRRDQGRWAAASDALSRALGLAFDPGSHSIRGRYRLLRLEVTTQRALLGLGSWRTRISARYEGVVPEGLVLAVGHGTLEASARDGATLAAWLDAHRRRELLLALLQGGVQVSGHTAVLETPGLLTDSEALRTLLGQLAELAKLLTLR